LRNEIENFKFSKVKLKCELFLKDIFIRVGVKIICDHRKIEGTRRWWTLSKWSDSRKNEKNGENRCKTIVKGCSDDHDSVKTAESSKGGRFLGSGDRRGAVWTLIIDFGGAAASDKCQWGPRKTVGPCKIKTENVENE